MLLRAGSGRERMLERTLADGVGQGELPKWLMPSLIAGTAIVVSMEFMVVGLVPVFVDELGISLGQAAWLVSAFALAAGVVGPVATYLFNRGRPFVTLSAIVALFGIIGSVAVVAPNYGTLLAARFSQGVLLTPFLGIASATAAALAEGQRAGRAGRAVGRITLGTVIGTVFAVPAALALSAAYGWQTVFAALAVLAFVASVCIGVFVPRGFRLAPAARHSLRPLLKARFAVHLLLSVVTFTAMFSSYTYIAAFLEEAVHMPPNAASAVVLLFGVAGIFGNWAASQVVDRAPVVLTLLVVGGLIVAAGLLPWTPHHWSLVGMALILWGIAHNGAFVACQVRVMVAAGNVPALGAALNISAANVGIALGALAGGVVVERFGMLWLGAGTVAIGLVALGIGSLLHLGSFASPSRIGS